VCQRAVSWDRCSLIGLLVLMSVVVVLVLLLFSFPVDGGFHVSSSMLLTIMDTFGPDTVSLNESLLNKHRVGWEFFIFTITLGHALGGGARCPLCFDYCGLLVCIGRMEPKTNCNSMEQSPFWEANRSSVNQETPRILWNSKVH